MTGRLRTCAVLFADISGSSRLYQVLGDAPALRRVRRCLEVLRQAVDSGGGRVVKHIGDGLMCDFSDSNAAVRAAWAMQAAMAREGDADPRLGVHIGCHHGLVIENAGDLFGDTVNVSARVAGLAGTGQIILTQEVARQLDESLQENLRQLDRASLKGLREPLAIFEFLQTRHPDLTVAAQPAASVMGSRLRLACRGRHVWLDRESAAAISLGREGACDLTVDDPEASRQHATIEVRGDRFVLVDHSSNGTYVDWEGADETCLKREEMILPIRGRIALGLSTRAPRATVVEFSREQ